jgi:NhaD family Na+/H+ antiporter
MLIVFIAGYFLITIEHISQINKSTVALLMGVICWLIQFSDKTVGLEANHHFLNEHLSSIAQIILFLLGALTIVETISAHKGFRLVSNLIQIQSKKKFLWVIGFIAFFLSSVLDNLTTTIVMVSLVAKLIEDREDRLLIGGAVVIAANAGGAWTPIGDVTTTMLWIGGQVSSLKIMKDLFIPSVVCLAASLVVLQFALKGNFKLKAKEEGAMEPFGGTIFFLGIGALIFVPVLKMLTGLPPFMGIMFGLGVLWLFTDFIHSEYDDRHHLRIPHMFSNIDMSGVLFFLGILLCIVALDTAGILTEIATRLHNRFENMNVIAILIGLISAVVDNVPLVAASMSMYSLEQFPQNNQFWQLIAFCAGTGGSILIIGSAAGVVFMGLEKVDFGWYLKRISLAALIGYIAGIIAYLAT